MYVSENFSAYRQRSYECRCCESIIVSICSSSHNFYVFVVHRNPDLSNKILYCFLTATSKVQSVVRNAYFVLLT